MARVANMELDWEGNRALLRVSQGIFSINGVRHALDEVLHECSARLIAGKGGWVVELRPMGEENLEEAGWKFNALLINHAFQRVIEGGKAAESGQSQRDKSLGEIERNLAELEQGFLSDPLGISKLWDEA
ncbi:MAG TPA: hypothetical protein VJB12_05000 [Candidatus Nanoarchaeia archaeon]|nr:hypothetical protein [Candidatus Nanoarchaeia archaeon]